jgi:hypothetical protein
MLRPWLFPGIAGLALLLLCCIGCLVVAGLRTWNLAKCWYCGAGKVRPSQSRSWPDKLVGTLFLTPYRCGGCLKRFYGFRTFPVEEDLPVAPVAITPVAILAVSPPPGRFRIRVRVIVKVPAFTSWDSFWEWATALEDVPALAESSREHLANTTGRVRSASAGS